MDKDFMKNLENISKKVLEESSSVMAAKIRYLQKLNGGLMTFMVKRGIMTKNEAKQVITKARQDAR